MNEIKLPKNEKFEVLNTTEGQRYLVTSTNNRLSWFIYKVLDDNKLEKLGKGTNPNELEEKYIVETEKKKGK